jgi:hypothetical protein
MAEEPSVTKPKKPPSKSKRRPTRARRRVIVDADLEAEATASALAYAREKTERLDKANWGRPWSDIVENMHLDMQIASPDLPHSLIVEGIHVALQALEEAGRLEGKAPSLRSIQKYLSQKPGRELPVIYFGEEDEEAEG